MNGLPELHSVRLQFVVLDFQSVQLFFQEVASRNSCSFLLLENCHFLRPFSNGLLERLYLSAGLLFR